MTRRPPLHDQHLARLAAFSDHSTLLAEIKAFVREEVARQLSLLSFTQPQHIQQPASNFVPTLRHAIELAIAEVSPVHRQQIPTVVPLSYAEVVTSPYHSLQLQLRPSVAPTLY